MACKSFGDASTVTRRHQGPSGLGLNIDSRLTAGAYWHDRQVQALSAMTKLQQNIMTAVIKLQDVVFVRAYLVPGPTARVDFARLERSLEARFLATDANPHNRAHHGGRAASGSARDFDEVEFVCASTGGRPFCQPPTNSSPGSQTPRSSVRPPRKVGLYNGHGARFADTRFTGLPALEAPRHKARRSPDFR